MNDTIRESEEFNHSTEVVYQNMEADPSIFMEESFQSCNFNDTEIDETDKNITELRRISNAKCKIFMNTSLNVPFFFPYLIIAWYRCIPTG